MCVCEVGIVNETFSNKQVAGEKSIKGPVRRLAPFWGLRGGGLFCGERVDIDRGMRAAHLFFTLSDSAQNICNFAAKIISLFLLIIFVFSQEILVYGTVLVHTVTI